MSTPAIPPQSQALVVGGGPLALLTALMLHRLGVSVSLAGESPPFNPPINPELMLIGGDDAMPALFQLSLSHWRQMSETLGLPEVTTTTTAVDLATSVGRAEKLQQEAMLDVIGGETVIYQPEPHPLSPLSQGAKVWGDAPMLTSSILIMLQQAVATAGIPRVASNPAALSITDLTQPQLTLENGSTASARHIVFTSARALRRVLPPLGLSLPLRPARGHVVHLQTSQPHGLPMVLQRLQRGHLFLVPVGPNRIDVHYDAINDPAQSTYNTQHSPALVTALQQHVSQLVPQLAGASLLGVNTVRHWLTPDFMPALGPWPGLPGVLVGTGWGGRTNAFAAGAAAMLTECVTGTPSQEYNLLAPNRFASGLWQVVKQPASLSWNEPNLVQPANLMSVKPDYAEHVNLTETPKPQYAANVQTTGKTITESAARRGTATVQTRSNKPKITTASLK